MQHRPLYRFAAHVRGIARTSPRTLGRCRSPRALGQGGRREVWLSPIVPILKPQRAQGTRCAERGEGGGDGGPGAHAGSKMVAERECRIGKGDIEKAGDSTSLVLAAGTTVPCRFRLCRLTATAVLVDEPCGGPSARLGSAARGCSLRPRRWDAIWICGPDVSACSAAGEARAGARRCWLRVPLPDPDELTPDAPKSPHKVHRRPSLRWACET